VRSVDEYVELMNNLKLPNPKMMDVAVPANMHVGLHQDDLAKQGLALTRARRSRASAGPTSCWSICARNSERAKHGMLPGALHAPYPGSRKACSPAACCARSRRRPAGASCSSAPSANARRWRCRREGRRPCQHRAYRRRHRRLEESRRAGGDGLASGSAGVAFLAQSRTKRRLESGPIDSKVKDMVLTDRDGSLFGDQKGMRCGETSPMPRLPPQL
jgi:hypothetical protein